MLTTKFDYRSADGSTWQTVTPDKNQNFQVQLLSNPIVNRQIVLSIQTGELGKYAVEIFDLSGRSIKKLDLTVTSAGSSRFNFDLPYPISQGIGLMRITNKSVGVKTLKIIF
jgi:hypothetical protein